MPSPPPARRRFTPRRIAVASGFVVIALVTAGALIALALTQEQPRWWKTVNASDPATISLAEAVENGMTTALTQVRERSTDEPDTGSRPWKIFITTDQANAWLSVRLRRWLQDQAAQGRIDLKWPPEVGPLQVRFEGGKIVAGAIVTRPGDGGAPRPETLTAVLRPEFKPDGSFWLTAETINIGRLPVPAGWVLPRTPAAGTEKVKKVSKDLGELPATGPVIAAFGGQAPVLSRPIIKLADGRRVRLLDIRPEDDRIVITCRTEDRPVVSPAAAR